QGHFSRTQTKGSKPPEGLEGERPTEATHIATCKLICEIFHKVGAAALCFEFCALSFRDRSIRPAKTQNPKLKTILRPLNTSRIGSQWTGSLAISSSDSRHLPRRFVPANSPNSTGKGLRPRSFPSGGPPKTGRRTSHLKIFSSITFPTRTAWNSKSGRSSSLLVSEISGQVPATSG